MFYIGRRQQKTSTLKIVLIVLACIAGVAALGAAAYALYKKFAPACIDCECEDFLADEEDEDEDLFDDCIEGECEPKAVEE